MPARHRVYCALGLALVLGSSPAWSAPKSKSAEAQKSTKKSAKKSTQEISPDDGLQKQMDWENKLLGPNTEKKIDLVKIQKLQAAEAARREKLEKQDKVDKERKEREAALAAQRNDVKAPSTRDVPPVVEALPPPKPVEKHDDAFVDKLLKDGKSGERKRPTVSNDDVDQLLAKAKQEKGASIALKPSKDGRPGGGRTDSVDQLLATADKQQAIKTTTKRASDAEAVSAEAAAREAALRAITEAAAKSEQERVRNKRPAIPDAAMLRAQQQTAPSRPEAPPPVAPTAAGWKDPFANEAAHSSRSKVMTNKVSGKISGKISGTVAPASARSGADGRDNPPSVRPEGSDTTEPAGGKSPPAGGRAKAKPAKPVKHPVHWKDPFA